MSIKPERKLQSPVEAPEVVIGSASTAPQAHSSSEQPFFQWTKQWYPLAVVDYLDPSKPNPIQLLGKDLVLWRDRTNTWRCFEDACPHRLAPLSEGRIEKDGMLLCSYHALRYDGDGHCVHMPQAKDAETAAKHCSSPNASATTHPIQERQGLLWVWGESGEAAWAESKQHQARTVPELDDDSGRIVTRHWNVRDFPYGWDFFMENVGDPAHVPIAHHGWFGDRYRDAKHFEMPCLEEREADGFIYGVTPIPEFVTHTGHDFQSPCLMRVDTKFIDGGSMILVMYGSPIKPGWTRHIGRLVLTRNEAGKVHNWLNFLAYPLPAWLFHILVSIFLNQDTVLLHHQEKIIAQRGKHWAEQVYTPNPPDTMVIALRRWLDKTGGIPWANGLSLSPERHDTRELFDVWNTHTKHCYVCQQALRRITWLIRLSCVVAIALVGVAMMVDAREMAGSGMSVPPQDFWKILAVSGVFAAIGAGLNRLRRMFYVYEFEHAKNP